MAIDQPPNPGSALLNYPRSTDPGSGSVEGHPHGPRTYRGDRRGQHVRRGRRRPGHGRHPRPPSHGRHHAQHLRHIRHGTHLGAGHGHKGDTVSIGSDARHHAGHAGKIHYKKHDPFHIKFSLRSKEARIAKGLGKTLIPHSHLTLLLYVDLQIYREYGILVYNTDARMDKPIGVASTNRGPRVGNRHHPALGLRHTHLAAGPTELVEDLHFFGPNSPGPHYHAPPAPHLPPVLAPRFS